MTVQMNAEELREEAEVLARKVWYNDPCWLQAWERWPEFYASNENNYTPKLSAKRKEEIKSNLERMEFERKMRIDTAQKYLRIMLEMGYGK